MAKGKFLLQVPHYFPGDLYLEAGTVVGDETLYPVEGPPSLAMAPVNELAQDEIVRFNKDRLRPDIPIPPLNPVGSNLAGGPGQVIQTNLGSGPPRGEGSTPYDRGMPVRVGDRQPRLTPTEQKIADERAAMEAEDRKIAADEAQKAGLERARAAARGATMVSREELARRDDAEKKAVADAAEEKKAAEHRAAEAEKAAVLKAAEEKAKTSGPGGVSASSPNPPATPAGTHPPSNPRPGFKPTLENSLPKPG